MAKGEFFQLDPVVAIITASAVNVGEVRLKIRSHQERRFAGAPPD